MFLPPKRKAIAIATLATCCFAALFSLSPTATAQEAEFNRRMAAMQQARNRAQQPAQETVTRVAQATTNVSSQPSNQRVIQTQAVTRVTSAPPATNRVARRGRFVPQHQRVAQIMDGTVIDGGAPVMGQSIIGSGTAPGMMMSQPGTIIDGTIMDGQVVTQPFIDQGTVMNGCNDGSCGGDCGSCGEVGGYFDNCCGRGGCPEGTPCWLNGLGSALRNSEFFAGFTSFRSTLFNAPGTANDSLVDDCSHGFYGGVNVGIPLCRLTCGMLSGQFGVRTVNTNFNGNQFTQDERNQLFFTAGFYRRVDYGLQFGVVADVLREEWFANSDLVQVRGDIGYVWPAGTSFGFRFATNVQDDVVSGTFNGLPFGDMIVATDDNYRFYLRHEAQRGGFGEVFAGWSESDQGIIGMDFDMPLTNRIAFEAGFTYYLNDSGVPANQGFIGGEAGQAYNTYIGFSLRPSGRGWFKNYDRPLFDVADNGSMLTIRN